MAAAPGRSLESTVHSIAHYDSARHWNGCDHKLYSDSADADMRESHTAHNQRGNPSVAAADPTASAETLTTTCHGTRRACYVSHRKHDSNNHGAAGTALRIDDTLQDGRRMNENAGIRNDNICMYCADTLQRRIARTKHGCP